jgi:hypothetical protein
MWNSDQTVEKPMPNFVELDNDQRREMVNTRQRFQAWLEASRRERGYRGSMIWGDVQGKEYLLRSYYDEHGRRRQTSLGRRDAKTEAMKQKFDTDREAAQAERKRLDGALNRQAAINRALGLGRVPLTTARIIRAFDRRLPLGHGLRVVGTNALYAYEAASGVLLDPGITATGDIELLYDARARLRLLADREISESSVLGILKAADRSFRRTRQSYRAANDDGYLVDLIAPIRNPPWKRTASAEPEGEDIEAASIEGLIWLENAPSFEQMALDEKGFPLRMVTVDPRAFAVHKHWVSSRIDRDPLKKTRDLAQAETVAQLLRTYLPHLDLAPEDMAMIPRAVVKKALAELGPQAPA